MERFGEKVRFLRKQRGLTTRQFGSMLGVYHTHVSQIERGLSHPSAKIILKIADIFGVSIDLLMRDELELE